MLYWGHLVSHHHFPCLNSYTGFQLITESNSNCPLLHIALLQYINHLMWLVSCTFLTSPGNSDHLPHSSFLFPELNWTRVSVPSLLLHPSFGMNSQPHWNLVKVLPLSVNISKLISSKLLFHLNSRRPLNTDDDPCMSPALEYDYWFCFVALLSSGLRGFKRHRSYIIIIIIIMLVLTCYTEHVVTPHPPQLQPQDKAYKNYTIPMVTKIEVYCRLLCDIKLSSTI